MPKPYPVKIIGTGAALPERVVTNAELSETLDTSDEWIQTRTGIKQRYIASESETTATLALAAAQEAIAAAGITADKIGLVIVATTSADHAFPSAASQVQAELGVSCPAFDLGAACSGYVHGLATASALMAQQDVKYALLIGADVFSRMLDWNDRRTAILFGDGAGATVLAANSNESTGLQAIQLAGDGGDQASLMTTGGIGSNGEVGHITMDGRTVYKRAVPAMVQAIESVLQNSGVNQSEVDWLIPHQANSRMIEAVCERLNFPLKKTILTVEQHANTSAASIPLAIHVHNQRFKPNDLILFVAFGAGFAWGSALLRW